MKWFAIFGLVLASGGGIAHADPGTPSSQEYTISDENTVTAHHLRRREALSYPSLSFGRTLQSRQANALRIDSTLSHGPEAVTMLRTHRIVHVIGSEQSDRRCVEKRVSEADEN